jgi:uncharacterized protein (DUF2235 family)
MPETRSNDMPAGSARPPRMIILCFDGTSGQFDSTVCPHTSGAEAATDRAQNSNVVKFYGLLRKDLPDKQLVYYQVCF